MLGLEVAGLELDHDIGSRLQVIEEEIDVEVFPAHFEVHLAPHEGEAGTQLQQELRDVGD
jgi:hypothetical protein